MFDQILPHALGITSSCVPLQQFIIDYPSWLLIESPTVIPQMDIVLIIAHYAFKMFIQQVCLVRSQAQKTGVEIRIVTPLAPPLCIKQVPFEVMVVFVANSILDGSRPLLAKYYLSQFSLFFKCLQKYPFLLLREEVLAVRATYDTSIISVVAVLTQLLD